MNYQEMIDHLTARIEKARLILDQAEEDLGEEPNAEIYLGAYPYKAIIHYEKHIADLIIIRNKILLKMIK